jgi:hypothetical protein
MGWQWLFYRSVNGHIDAFKGEDAIIFLNKPGEGRHSLFKGRRKWSVAFALKAMAYSTVRLVLSFAEIFLREKGSRKGQSSYDYRYFCQISQMVSFPASNSMLPFKKTNFKNVHECLHQAVGQ